MPVNLRWFLRLMQSRRLWNDLESCPRKAAGRLSMFGLAYCHKSYFQAGGRCLLWPSRARSSRTGAWEVDVAGVTTPSLLLETLATRCMQCKFGKAGCDAHTHHSSRTMCTTGPTAGDLYRSCLVAHTDNVLASEGPIHKSKHHTREKEDNVQNKPGKEAGQSHCLKGQMPSIRPEPLQQVGSPSYHS